MLGLPDRKGIWGYPPINQKTWKAGYRFRGVLGPLSQKYYYSRRNADLSLKPDGTCRFLE